MFQDLIKKKGLLGGKYSRGLEEEVNSLLYEMDNVEENQVNFNCVKTHQIVVSVEVVLDLSLTLLGLALTITVGICSRGSQEPTFKVWSTSGQ